MLDSFEKKNFLIFRFSCEEFANDLYKNGTVYMKSLEYFKRLEDVQGKQYLRGDKHEGLKKIVNYSNKNGKLWLTLTIPEKEDITLHPINVTLREYNNQLPLNIYCMTAVDNKSDDGGNIALNARSLEFGTHFVFFKNSQAFYDRLEAELKRLDYKYWFGHVQYYNEKEFSGELTYFHKPDIFSWQKEFRLVVKHPENLRKDLVVKLGSLEDIADIVRIES